MSDLTPAEERTLAWQTLPCRTSTCLQPAGRRCITSSGERTSPHAPRIYDIRAYLLGQATMQAENDALTTQVASIKASYDQVTAALSTSDDKLDMAMQRLANLQLDLTHAQADLAAANAKIAELEAPPAPPKSTTLFGFWGGTDTNGAGTSARDNYDRVSSYMGGPGAYRMFYSGLPQANFVGSNADYGPAVVVSFKASPLDVIAGKHDAYLRSWFATIPATRQVWWSYWHEPEDDIERGAFTPEQYRAAWEHIIALAPKRDTLLPVLILMGFSLFKTSRKIADYVAKGLYGLFWDSYLTGTTKTIANVIDKPRAVSESFGLAFGITEVAVASGYNLPGMDHAATVTELATELRTHTPEVNAKVVLWFESNKSDGDWRMRPFAAAVSAWVAAT